MNENTTHNIALNVLESAKEMNLTLLMVEINGGSNAALHRGVFVSSAGKDVYMVGNKNKSVRVSAKEVVSIDQCARQIIVKSDNSFVMIIY